MVCGFGLMSNEMMPHETTFYGSYTIRRIWLSEQGDSEEAPPCLAICFLVFRSIYGKGVTNILHDFDAGHE